ncbi:hypothetical protein TNCV_2853051 [Trichonephila clavipes]|uniref:Uncharacterized protein n=1 Tax=Trichonephila clavipes TaxID=2585209 RepID=A0A8X6R7L9_TRICX|nr:hypothetical protein TNCV_2853051 [Trichonephila clavipes]
MSDYTRHAMFKSCSMIAMRCSVAVCSPDLLPIENVWTMFAQRLVRDTPLAATPDQLRQHVEATWTAVP